jgi:predicted nucleic acid-binding protein
VIFLDTGFVFAFIAERDVNHSRAFGFLEQYEGRPLSEFVITTNHVVSETLTFVRTRAHAQPAVRHELAVKVGESLFGGAEALTFDAHFSHRFTTRPGPR